MIYIKTAEINLCTYFPDSVLILPGGLRVSAGGSNTETRVEKRGSDYALHRPMRIGTASRMQHVRALGRACTPVPNFPADVIFQDYFLFTAEEKKDTI